MPRPERALPAFATVLMPMPIPEIALPVAESAGAMSAILPRFSMRFFCSSSLNDSHDSLRSSNIGLRSCKTSTKTGNTSSPISAPRSFNSFIVVVNSSIGSRVASNVLSRLPEKSLIFAFISVNEIFPSLIALYNCANAFEPKRASVASSFSASDAEELINASHSAITSFRDVPSSIAFAIALRSAVTPTDASTPCCCI